MPFRRSIHVRVLKNGGKLVASNGSGTAGKRTRNKRKTRSLAARSRATFSSSLAQSPTPFGPMKKPQADEARRPAASSSCHLPPGVRHHLSSHGSSPACFNFAAIRSTAGLSRLLWDRKMSRGRWRSESGRHRLVLAVVPEEGMIPPDVARAAFCTRSRTVIQILF